ncbi:zinc-ribbon domain-containing protein [Metabacillus fastidiosus]
MKKMSDDLIKEWHWEKNIDLNPNSLNVKAKTKLWWKCEKEHEWEARLDHRKRRSGCPYCSGQVLATENSLAITHPQVASEWHPIKNTLSPFKVSRATTRVFWWFCEDGHEWRASVANRTRRGDRCPYCSGKIATKETCLQNQRPDIAREWNYKKNGSLTPNDVTLMSNKLVWWSCEKGHEWEDKVAARINGNRCSVCFPRKPWKKVSEEYNFEVVNPHLMAEWHPTKNKLIDPSKLSPVSGKKVWWKCQECNYEWEANIDNRKQGKGCPKCNYGFGTSFQEQCLFYYLSKIFPECINKHVVLINNIPIEIDIFIPNLNIAIEYDGYFYHLKRGENDEQKNKKLSQKMKLIRIRENNGPNKKLPIIKKHGSIEIQCNGNDPTDIPNAFKQIIETIVTFDISSSLNKMDIDIDVKRDNLIILALARKHQKERSLAFLFPNIAEEWHKEKNGKLSTWNFSPGSSQRVWWECKVCSKEWHAIINRRVKGQFCPYCAGNKASHLKSLLSENPAIAAMWHPNKNEGLTPEEVLPGSQKEAWWYCSNCKQEWKEPIHRRASKKGCPYCNGWRVFEGNCLSTRRPHLAELWHPIKNKNLDSHDVTEFSGKIVWWYCSDCKQEWEEPVYRMSKKKGCPYCNNYRVYEENCLATLSPHIAQLWHPTRNGYLTPRDVKSSSRTRVWWLCECGKEYEKPINKMKNNTCTCK